MPTTKEQYQTRLDEAELAMHRLATGAAVVSVDSPSGERVAYQPTELHKLEGYIDFLKRQIAALDGRVGRPIHFGFSRNS